MSKQRGKPQRGAKPNRPPDGMTSGEWRQLIRQARSAGLWLFVQGQRWDFCSLQTGAPVLTWNAQNKQTFPCNHSLATPKEALRLAVQRNKRRRNPSAV